MIARLAALLLAAALSWSGTALAQQSPPAKVRMALIIGNSDYDQTDAAGRMRLKVLPNACPDAQKVAAKLVLLGWKETDEVTLACNQKTAQMSGLIGGFVQKFLNNPGAVAFFYFAGHGAQVDNSSFVFGVDAAINIATDKRTIDQQLERRLFAGSAIDTFNDFFAQIGQNPDSGFTALIDACRSDPLIVALNGDGPRRVTAPRNAPVKYPGQLIGVSTQNGDVALDGAGANGPYALALYDNLDLQDTLVKTMLKVTMQVMKTTRALNPNRPQIPTYDGSSMIECLGRCRGDPSPTAPAPNTHSFVERPAIRLAAWQSAPATQAPPTGMIPAWPWPRLPFQQTYRKALSPSPSPSTPVDVSGLRINIFWCDGVAEAARNQALAGQLQARLTASAVRSSDVQFVNIRVLTAQANAGPGFRYLTNTVSYDPANPRATARVRQAAAVVRSDAVVGKVRDDVTFFVCEATTSSVPARVFWQVPNDKWLIYVRGLQSMINESAGHFQSVRGIEVVKNAPDTTEVRFYFDQDRAAAFRLADSIQALTGTDVAVKQLAYLAGRVRPGTVEAWLSRSLSDAERQRIESMRVPKDVYDSLRAVKSTAPSRNRVLTPLT